MGGTMDSGELKKRTKRFALAVVRFVESLPRRRTADVMGGQLLRAGTSVAANYRSACRARSRRDFISKITIVEEEADESCFWLEMFLEAGIVERTTISWLLNEAKELTAIFTASGRTAKGR
jgi:four helix bundle protein